MIELDGTHGEGGGAILRQALALSIYTGKPFRIDDIRAGRPEPGMKMQHLKALNAAQRLCNAKIDGNRTGATTVEFQPERLESQSLKIDIETAGSVTLFYQALLLPCVFSLQKFKLEVTGGTDVKWSQPFDYFQNVFLPHLTKYADIETNLVKRGYYPKGGGNVKVTIEGKGEPEQPIQLLSQGDLLQIKGVSHASRDLQDSRVAERQAKSCELALSNLDCPVTIRREYAQTRSTGSGITVRAIYGGSDGVDMNNPVALGADALGEPSKKAEDVGEDAANQLQKVVGTDAAADKYLADQLVPFLAVAGGALMTSEVTSHVLSNIYVAEAFLPVSFNIEQNTIRCTSRSD